MEELLEGPGAGRPTDTHCPPAGGPWFTHQDTHSLRESLLRLGHRHVEPYIPHWGQHKTRGVLSQVQIMFRRRTSF